MLPELIRRGPPGLIYAHTARFTLIGVGATQVPLSGMAAALIGLAVAAVVVLNFFWELLQHGMVMAHEGGHAAVSAMPSARWTASN